MSKVRIRFRFGLRLLLLTVALLATVLAWRHAVVERQRAEWDSQGAPLESELERLKKRKAQLHRTTQESKNPSFIKELSRDLPLIDADIAAVKKRLEELNPRP